jgi:hypothetical protein
MQGERVGNEREKAESDSDREHSFNSASVHFRDFKVWRFVSIDKLLAKKIAVSNSGK